MNPSTQSTTAASTSLRARPRVRPAYAAIAVLLAAAIAIQVVRDRGWKAYEPENSVMWLRSGDAAKRAALSYDELAADVYWIRAVIYYGERRLAGTHRTYDQLYALLDLVTSLDPRFKAAYRFGALFLSEPPPGGPGRPDLAIALLERGVERDGDWEYYEDIGFVHYWWRHDYKSAAEWFKRAAERPGAPSWLLGLAATTLAVGGSRESSRQLWTELLNNVDAAYIRNQAEHRLQQLDAMDTIDTITAALQRFRDRTGRMPSSWQELAAAERWRGIPVDPAGVPFVVDAQTGKVDVAKSSPMWPLPAEPTQGPPR
ncbi:MAG: type II secretion system protein GspG [Cyanobacteria bacterium]|nr:type II secretion system protein GspG [Cyanobacteriota bacterium]